MSMSLSMTNPPDASLPVIIQGGMGVAISHWGLANAVARRGQLGVISGVALERLLTCRLQEGDPAGHMRRALAAFPIKALADEVVGEWYQPNGLPAPGAYRGLQMFAVPMPARLARLTVVAAFVEIWLAKEGHTGPVGLNLLEKIQAPILPSLYGAMLAGVDYILMGAGIPKDVPGQLDKLVKHEVVVQRLALPDGGTTGLAFDPGLIAAGHLALRRPRFLAIVSTDVLAASLNRIGGVDGFVVEAPVAGGHNAPPRGGAQAPDGTPMYGPRDVPDLKRLAALGKPFWMAGGMGDAGALERAWAAGAQGVQVGTAFALCSDSGMRPDLRAKLIAQVKAGTAVVRTDGRASPTGFPFKTVDIIGDTVDGSRVRRTCSMGYLRSAFTTPDGSVGWRCASESEVQWVAKGGAPQDSAGRTCLCHGLLSSAGHAHAISDGQVEPALITAGDDLVNLGRYLNGRDDYDAGVVLDHLLSGVGSATH